MIDRLFDDPTFFPITILFFVCVVVALWQKLDRFIILLVVVYIAFVMMTIVPSPKKISDVVSKTIPKDEIINNDSSLKEITIPEPIEFRFNSATSGQEEIKNPIKELPDLWVNSHLMCETVIDSLRKPVGKAHTFPVSISKVYCYSGIRNMRETRTLFHEWYHENIFINSISFKIGRSVHWRVWTVKKLTIQAVGNWQVIIRDSLSHTALDTVSFTIIDN